MRKCSIPWTRLAALPLTLLLVVCGGASAKANDKPAFSQSGTQGVSMTWTIENLYFDGRLLALDVLVSPSDARYSACNDVLGDYADFTEADDARAEGFIPLGFYCEADIWADSVPETGSVLGSGERKGSEAMRRFRWMLTSEEAAQVRSIHLDCGIMETPGQLTSEEIYVLDIPKPDTATVIQVSVNAEQVKTNRIREILLTQTDTVTNIYLYYDNTGYGPRVPLDYTCSNHPDAFVFNIYDDRKQLNCLVLSIPSAEIDLTAHTLPVQDLENNQLITIDLQTGIAT